MTIPFQQVDVFTSVPFMGNPVAVILDGNNLTKTQMQSIANWTNLSETTFVCLPTVPDADYRLRIFTPNSELPFAGHPTIGSAWALIQHGLKPKLSGRLIQECEKGLITLRIAGENLFFALPAPMFTKPDNAQITTVAKALRIAPDEIILSSIIDVGAVWFTAQLLSAEKVINVKPDMSLLSAPEISRLTGVTIFGLRQKDSVSDIEVRSFAPAHGVPEDPVCGSGNGCVGALIRRNKVLNQSSYVASQGSCVRRNGKVRVEFDETEGTIWVGGNAVTCISGLITI